MWGRRKSSGRWPSEWLACGLAFVIVASPILIDYALHPDHLLARPAAVSPLQGEHPAKEILKNLVEAAGMFHWRGDHVSKQNIPHAPALNPIEGIFFLVGLASVGIRLRRRKINPEQLPQADDGGRRLAIILLGWLILGMSPTVFTQTDSPNFLRTLVVTPAAAMLIAIGLHACWRFAEAQLRWEWATPLCAGMALALLFVSGQWTARQVFFEWAQMPEVWHGFNGEFAQLGSGAFDHLKATPAGTTFWLPAYLEEHVTFRYLAGEYTSTNDQRIRGYKNLDFLRPQAGATGDRLIVATAHNQVLPILQRLVTGGDVVATFRAPEGNVWALLYKIPADALPPEQEIDAAQKRIREDIAW